MEAYTGFAAVYDELMDNISLILTVANGLYNPENHIESE